MCQEQTSDTGTESSRLVGTMARLHQSPVSSLLTFSADTGRGMRGAEHGAGSQAETKKALKINCQDLRHRSLITASTSRHPRPRSGEAVKCYLGLSTLSTLSVCTTDYKYLLSSLCAQSGSGWNIHEKMFDNANVYKLKATVSTGQQQDCDHPHPGAAWWQETAWRAPH